MLPLQTSNKKAFTILIAGFCLLLAFVMYPSHAHALTISPARIEISGDPGATVGGSFTLINEQSTSQTFYVSYENFTADGDTGTPSFNAEKSDLDTWITVNPTQVTIAPGQAMQIPYSIAIPQSAQPGGYFAAIFWGDTPPATGTNQVSIGAKIGLLILLSVNGNVTESAGINQFDRSGHGFFYTSLPVDMQYKFRNNGGDRVQPVGDITIRDAVFIRSARLDANSAQGNVLPGSARQFSVEWLKHAAPLPIQGFFNNVSYEWQNFAVGLYSAHLNLAYGTEGLRTSKTLWFFVVPWQLLICIIVGLLIIWWIFGNLIRRYNRYIIKQARADMTRRDVDRS